MQKVLSKTKLLVVLIALKIITFLDYLENAPLKTYDIFVRGVLYIFIVFLSFTFLAYDLKTKNITNLLNYVFVGRVYHQPLEDTDPYPKLTNTVELPVLTSESYLVLDISSGTVLLSKNSDQVLPPASTTKLMTALIALEIYDLEDAIEFPAYCTMYDTQRVGYLPGELVKVKDLIYSLLITSAGDSACALADKDGSFNLFVDKMNKRAKELQMNTTNFTNPIGLDGPDFNHVSSADDLATLSITAVGNSKIQEIVRIKEYDLQSGYVIRKIFNTNDLLWDIEGTVGIKTGRTYAAGEVLSYEYNKDEINLLIIVMRSEDRFGDTKKLLDWVLTSYTFN